MITSRNRTIKKIAYLLIPVLICLFPILNSGLYSDDGPTFAKYNLEKNTVEQAQKNVEKDLLIWKDRGRINYVAHIYNGAYFYLFRTVKTAKLANYILAIIAFLSFSFFLYLANPNLPIFSFAFVYIALVQFRVNMDAYTSLNGMYPLFAILLFSTLSLFVLYVKQNQFWLIIMSVFLFTLALFFIEIAVLIIPAVWCISYGYNRSFKKSFVQAFPYIFILVVYAILLFHAKLTSPKVVDAYTGIIINLDFPLVVQTFLRQLLASLPLTIFINVPAVFYKSYLALTMGYYLLLGILVIVFLHYFFESENQHQEKIENPIISPKILFFIALLLLTIPAMIISITQKYQEILMNKIGFGYLPVYIQHFGMAILFILLLKWVGSHFHLLYSRLLKILFLSFAILTFSYNIHEINGFNYLISNPIIASYSALKSGILDSCPNGSTVTFSNDYFYFGPYAHQILLLEKLGKNVNVEIDYSYDLSKIDSTHSYFNCSFDRLDRIQYHFFKNGQLHIAEFNAKQYNTLAVDTVIYK